MDYYKNFKKFSAQTDEYYSEIIMDIPEIGSYLYIYEKGEGKYDYLQDTVDICKEQALDEFGIPLDCWEEVKE